MNIAGRTIEDYCEVVEKLAATNIDLLELNISCPNVKEGGIGFGTSPQMAAEVTRRVKEVSKQPLIVKLSPNVTDIVEIAKAVEGAGADGLSLINTLVGMKIDVNTKKPVLANKIGGFSGPAIKPVAVRMVYQVAQAVDLPIIGLGGIMTGEDAAEFILAGADAISVGTATFANPRACIDIKEGLINYMNKHGFKSIKEIQDAFQG